jgi:nucleoside-diphosphate-sugar epimerase
MKLTLSILVTGAAGVIGSRLARRLVEQGHRVRALVLPDDPHPLLEGVACEIVRGDVRRPETLLRACEGIHTVYHLAAVLLSEDEALFREVNVVGTRNLLDAAARRGVSHFVHVSSASVVYPRSTPYSRSKRAAEELVRSATAFPVTLARPTLVYEEGGGLEFATFIAYLERWPVVLLIGDGSARKKPVHSDDLVVGLAAIAGNPASHGATYGLAGGETLSLRELAELVLGERGRRKWMIPIPVAVCRAAAIVLGPLTGRRLLLEHTLAGLTQDADLDSSAAERDLGYRPLGVREGIRRCRPRQPVEDRCRTP